MFRKKRDPLVLKQDVTLQPLAKVRDVLNLLSATAFRKVEPAFIFKIFAPVDQCSTCFPVTTIRAVFHSPMGWGCLVGRRVSGQTEPRGAIPIRPALSHRDGGHRRALVFRSDGGTGLRWACQ